MKQGNTAYGKAPHKPVLLLLSFIFKEYILNDLAGTKLLLPMDEAYYPRVENFLWHLGERFEK